MLFVVDVGNTNITFGVYDKEELKTTFRMMSKSMHTSDEYGLQIIGLLGANGISVEDIDGCIVVSVVPNVMHSLRYHQHFHVRTILDSIVKVTAIIPALYFLSYLQANLR